MEIEAVSEWPHCTISKVLRTEVSSQAARYTRSV